MRFVVLKEYSSINEKILLDRVEFDTYLGAKTLYEYFKSTTNDIKKLYYKGIVSISIIKENGEVHDVLDEEYIEVGN